MSQEEPALPGGLENLRIQIERGVEFRILGGLYRIIHRVQLLAP